MSALWSRLRWRAAVVAGGLLALLALITHEEAWAWLGVDHLTPFFFDLVAILAAGQAWSKGLDVYAPNLFDPYHRPHVYGPWWLVSGPLGLTTTDARWLGWLLVGAFFIAAAAVLAPRRPGAALVSLLLLLSPPVLYGVERGNNDLVVFVLIAAAGALLARAPRRVGFAAAWPGTGAVGWGAGLLWLAAALKIYPFAALPALAACAGPRRRVLAWLGGTAGVCGLVFLLWRADYTHALAIAPRPETIFAYGWGELPWAWKSWEKLPHLRVTLLLAVLPVVAVAVGWAVARRRVLLAAVPLTGAATVWFVAGALAWLFCWAANTNYPYRAVLLLLPAGLWLAQAAGADLKGASVARTQLAGCVLTLWLWLFKSWWAVALNGGLAGSDRWLVAVFGVEQALVIGLNLALALGVAGWAWRRWHAPDEAGPEGGNVDVHALKH